MNAARTPTCAGNLRFNRQPIAVHELCRLLRIEAEAEGPLSWLPDLPQRHSDVDSAGEQAVRGSVEGQRQPTLATDPIVRYRQPHIGW